MKLTTFPPAMLALLQTATALSVSADRILELVRRQTHIFEGVGQTKPKPHHYPPPRIANLRAPLLTTRQTCTDGFRTFDEYGKTYSYACSTTATVRPLLSLPELVGVTFLRPTLTSGSVGALA